MEDAVKLVDAAHMSRIIGLKPATIRRLAAQGFLPCYRLRGRFRFDPGEVLRSLRAVESDER